MKISAPALAKNPGSDRPAPAPATLDIQYRYHLKLYKKKPLVIPIGFERAWIRFPNAETYAEAIECGSRMDVYPKHCGHALFILIWIRITALHNRGSESAY